MSTFQTIKTQLQKLLDEANAKTTKTDADITTAMSTLIEGYGVGDSGGGSSKTYADQLYEFYGVDKSVYPYVSIVYMGSEKTLAVAFGKTVSQNTSSKLAFTGIAHKSVILSDPIDNVNLETLVNRVMYNIRVSDLSYGSGSASWTMKTGIYVASNFDVVSTAISGKYDLNQ